MTPTEFLKAVWPTTGLYAIATPYKIPNTDRVTYTHKVFETAKEAAVFAKTVAGTKDVFFAVHSLKEAKVWNPEKVDYKTGEKGAYQIRVQRNMAAARCFFFDLDVGVETERTPKYASAKEALQNLIQFCEAAQLPKPLVTSSGGGLHVYWLLEEDIPSDDWRKYASDLRALAKHHGLKADPARTTDTASVLRVAGTFNHKDPSNPRAVKVLTPEATHTPNEMFLKLLSDALTKADIKAADAMPDLSKAVGIGAELGANIGTERDFDEAPTTSIESLIKTCGQVRYFIRSKGRVPEPEWYKFLGLIQYVVDGEAICHGISKGDDAYTYEETQTKLEQVKKFGPTLCSTLMETCGEENCEGCPFKDKGSTPLVHARRTASAPPPEPVEESVWGSGEEDDEDTPRRTYEPPAAPLPYVRLESGGIGVKIKNSDDEEVTVKICEYDLYPLRRVVRNIDAHTRVQQQVWRAILPRKGPQDFVMDAEALYDHRKFGSVLLNNSVYVAPNNLKEVQSYMVAYIAELQKAADEDVQREHLGWDEDGEGFIMPDYLINNDGELEPVTTTDVVRSATDAVTKGGSMEQQLKLLRFYNHHAYRPNQFMIAASLAAPFFYMTGYHGAILNASGEAGSSKSSTLYTAASLWAEPERYPMDGTRQGATAKGRNNRIHVLANLPVCMDEITHMSVKDAEDFAMGVTQVGPRVALNSDGTERRTTNSMKSTFVLSTSNSGLHNTLATNNTSGTAGSMRVLELDFEPQYIHEKFEADEYMREIRKHFGHVGPEFIRRMMPKREGLEREIVLKMASIERKAKIKSAERFWSGTAAVVLVILQHAYKMGLLPFDPVVLEAWVIDTLIPTMRGTVKEEYATPFTLLTDYLNLSYSAIIVFGPADNYEHGPQVTREPKGALVGQYDMRDNSLWLAKAPFKKYCQNIGANSTKVLNDLHTAKPSQGSSITRRIVPVKESRQTLGKGTDFSAAQTRCFSVNMDHPEITGAASLELVKGGSPETAPAQEQKRAER